MKNNNLKNHQQQLSFAGKPKTTLHLVIIFLD